MSSIKQNTSLTIQDLELHINLGWLDNERRKQQTVLLTLQVDFPEPPKACDSDDLVDTVCYSTLIKKIRDQLATRNFHLIEHLSKVIYDLVADEFPSHSHIIVNITKYPPIARLGHVTFRYAGE